jgi:hypothetical protein
VARRARAEPHRGRSARGRSSRNALNFDPAADFANLVLEATLLRALTTDLVPGVFQLPDYTNAVLQSDDRVRTARLAMVREMALGTGESLELIAEAAADL